MPSRDRRVDDYIRRAAPFARPVLVHLRAVIHAAVPEVEETIKWGFPHFTQDGILCCFAAFKAHSAFAIRRGDALLGRAASGEAMGQFGRITAVSDLPPRREIARLLRAAARLNAAPRPAAPRARRAPRPEAKAPPDLVAALRRNARARAAFDGFPPSARREYVEWIVGAKADETRARRVAQAVAWMAEGKRRNWKYERC